MTNHVGNRGNQLTGKSGKLENTAQPLLSRLVSDARFWGCTASFIDSIFLCAAFFEAFMTDIVPVHRFLQIMALPVYV